MTVPLRQLFIILLFRELLIFFTLCYTNYNQMQDKLREYRNLCHRMVSQITFIRYCYIALTERKQTSPTRSKLVKMDVFSRLYSVYNL